MRVINEQDVFDIVDDLRDRMTVEGYWSVIERVKALPSATYGNLEKPEIPQHSEDEAADCNLDCISRQMLLEYIHGEPVGKLLCDKYNLDGLIEQFPSAQPEIKTDGDTISRQAAIDLVRDVCNAVMSGCESWHDPETEDEVYKDIREVDAILKCNKEVRIALRNMPSAQQDCTECEDYDHETKSCPKFCDVIRRTLEEAKQERTGRWMATEADEPCFYRCSECGRLIDERENFCPNCGAKMEGEG